MANGEEKIIKSEDFYAVLGLDKECNQTELKNAYKKLAMRWHPDRCSASGNSKFVEEANTKFQAIQQAYSVLSNADKRFLYDVGVYDNDDDDDNNGMGDFLNEMAGMMHQAKPNENGEESFEQLQELFEEMFNGDVDLFGTSTTSSCNQSSKRNSSEMNSGLCSFNADLQNFCVGVSTYTHTCILSIRNLTFHIYRHFILSGGQEYCYYEWLLGIRNLLGNVMITGFKLFNRFIHVVLIAFVWSSYRSK